MVSRRKILNRSRDDLNIDQEEEDIWFSKDKLYKEHIQEVLDKWTQIDDEIWAKVIVFERNRRVAKAYARVPVLTVNGSDDGFDGMRIGLCGFENPMRDAKTAEVKRQIGQGVKIKMDDAGNILLRRYAKSNVYIKSTSSAPNEETAIGADVLKQPNQCLEIEKVYKIFDMKKFQANVNRELSRSYPDRRRLETQCLSIINFVKSENDILECPIWIMIVNVVAMDMLKSKLPPVQRPVDIKNRPRIPIPDEDPYSEAGNSASSSGSSGGGSGSAGEGNGRDRVAATREQLLIQSQQFGTRRSEKPPKLPPRDNVYHHDMPKPDYDDIESDGGVVMKPLGRSGKSDKGKDNKKFDDPYYCGLKARVPNFAKANGNAINSSSNSSNNSKSVNGTVSEKKTSFFGTKKDSKSKDKDKEKDKDKDKDKDVKEKEKEKEKDIKEKESVSPKQRPSTAQMPHPASFSTLYQLHQMQNGTTQNGTIKHNVAFHRHFSQPDPYMWHAKSYESGIDAEFDPPYPIYGRLPTPARGYVPVVPRTMYVGDWE